MADINRRFIQKIRFQTMNHKRTQFSLFPKIINGCLAGIIGVTMVYPLDLAKTRLQSQPVGERLYTSPLDCLIKILKKEGFFGIYKGSLSYLSLIAPEKAMKLTMNDYFRFQLQDEDGYLPLHKQTCAAALAGLSALWITTPMDLLKIDLQNAGRHADRNDPNRKTAATIIKGVYRKNGILGFYKGFIPTITRDVSFSSLYFPLFAFFSSIYPKNEHGEPSFWSSFFCGLGAGSVAAWSITPIDVMKTRMQLISNVKSDMVYTGIIDAAKNIYKNEGIRAFYKGGGCRIMVVGPLFAVAQGVYYLKISENIFGIK